MRTSRTYTLSLEDLTGYLVGFALSAWGEHPHETRPAALQRLAYAYLEQVDRHAQEPAEPPIVGHCAYCERTMYADELLYKEPYQGGYIWVCYLCHPMQSDAVPALPDDGIADTYPVWKPVQPAHGTADA